MSATAKFYTGLAVALALIVAVSFAIGYARGFRAGAASVRPAHRVALAVP